MEFRYIGSENVKYLTNCCNLRTSQKSMPWAAGDGGGDKHDDCDYYYKMKRRKEELEKEEGKKTILLKYMYQGRYSMNTVKN
jgi:hypothetical protein